MKALLVPWPQAAAVRGARCACTEHPLFAQGSQGG